MITSWNKATKLFGKDSEKPTTATNGTIFIAVDSGNTYIFNEEDSTWTTLGKLQPTL